MGAVVFVYSALRTVSTTLVLLYGTGRQQALRSLELELIKNRNADIGRAQLDISESSLLRCRTVLTNALTAGPDLDLDVDAGNPRTRFRNH